MNSVGFWVAITMKGSGRVYLFPSTVTEPSAIASRSADCVLGEVLLISSARIMRCMMAPSLYSNSPVFILRTTEPVTSEGSVSGVN